jgi:hypothetical protein
MAYGLGGAQREELKDKQLLSLRTELRSYPLNGSGMNKIVRSSSATPCSIKRSELHVKLAIVATALLAVFGGGRPVFAEEIMSEPRCVRGLSTGAGVLSAGRFIFSDSVNASASERDSGIDGHARTPQTLSWHHDALPLRARDRPLRWSSRVRVHH